MVGVNDGFEYDPDKHDDVSSLKNLFENYEPQGLRIGSDEEAIEAGTDGYVDRKEMQ